MSAVAAVDLGATSGRVILGYVGGGRLRMEHVARFPNQPVQVFEGVDENGSARFGLHWNILELYRSVTAGLAQAVRDEPGVVSIGVDSWAVDYALLRGGRMLGAPYHYRDDRNPAAVGSVHDLIGAAELYGRNGLQHLAFNTVFQLAADRASGSLALADQALLIPDLIGYWLTGRAATEVTNASTTGLLDPLTRQWDTELLGRVGVPAGLLAPLIAPGESLGALLPGVAAELGLPGVAAELGLPGSAAARERSGSEPERGRLGSKASEERPGSERAGRRPLEVIAVGSHDTASAVVAVPSSGADFAYISSGTWSLVGVELEAPVLSDAGRHANFTNEGGVDGRVRYLKNVSGLWLLSESVRTWERASGTRIELPELLAAAGAVNTSVSVFDAADDRFIAPGDMPSRIAEWCAEHGAKAPQTPAEFTRSILESLAAAYATTVAQAGALTGTAIRAIHIVGGGSQNALLCQLTADRTGLTVLAGPVEATAIGNILVQARAAGLVARDSSLEALREIVAATFQPVRYVPRG